MKTIEDLRYEDRAELIVRLAEMASVLREVRAAGAAEPVLCLLDCVRPVPPKLSRMGDGGHRTKGR